METSEFWHYLHKGQLVGGELPSSGAERRAWVGIYPLRLDEPGCQQSLAREGILIHPARTERLYRIRTFELLRSLENTWFCEDDMENKCSYVAIGDDDLLAKLSALKISLALLDVTWRNDCPL